MLKGKGKKKQTEVEKQSSSKVGIVLAMLEMCLFLSYTKEQRLNCRGAA